MCYRPIVLVCYCPLDLCKLWQSSVSKNTTMQLWHWLQPMTTSVPIASDSVDPGLWSYLWIHWVFFGTEEQPWIKKKKKKLHEKITHDSYSNICVNYKPLNTPIYHTSSLITLELDIYDYQWINFDYKLK